MLSWDEVDLSALRGRGFVCIDQCQLCCLHPSELNSGEIRYFKAHHPDMVETREEPHRHHSLAMRHGIGPCVFLVDGRCEVYEHRPSFCRQYPIHLHIGERAEAELDLSCRGVWTDEGEDMEEQGKGIVKSRWNEIGRILTQTRHLYRMFYETCEEAGIFSPPEKIRKGASRLHMIGDLSYLGKVLEMSTDEDPMYSMPDGAPILKGKQMDMLRDSITEMALDSLRSDDLFGAPIYCDPSGRWNLIFWNGKQISWSVLDEEGELTEVDAVEASEVEIVPTTGRGEDFFVGYMRTLNRRDSVLGYAYHLVDLYGYEDFVSNTYYGVLATSAADLMWRSSLLRHLFPHLGNEEAIREGIIFYDTDRLGAPTIGMFL